MQKFGDFRFQPRRRHIDFAVSRGSGIANRRQKIGNWISLHVIVSYEI
jgi:hypothetical protein